MSTDCLFCKIVAREIGSEIVFETAEVTAFRDIAPAAPVHVLVVPNEHVVDARELQESQAGLLMRMVQAAREIAAREGIEESGYRLVLNVGPDAGQTVFHLHMHVLGGRPLGGVAG